ncbi:MAG: (d)CMP kinase, partial [Hyphomicrobiales bacterium]|nr:(d)CMP kinase [Hyphomicrobiales bacterium]
GLPHLDTGLLYRATARAVLDQGHVLSDVNAAVAAAEALDAANLPEKRLRGAEMGEAASVVAAMPPVRAALVDLQQRFARAPAGAVLDGRDIGTVICPDATVKLFVTASPTVRAARRHKELASQPGAPDFDTVLADIRRRDARDSGRADAPLKAADDAVVIDTSALDIDEALAAAMAVINARRLASGA